MLAAMGFLDDLKKSIAERAARDASTGAAKALGKSMGRSDQSSPMAAVCAHDKPKLCKADCAALCLSSTPKCAC